MLTEDSTNQRAKGLVLSRQNFPSISCNAFISDHWFGPFVWTKEVVEWSIVFERKLGIFGVVFTTAWINGNEMYEIHTLKLRIREAIIETTLHLCTQLKQLRKERGSVKNDEDNYHVKGLFQFRSKISGCFILQRKKSPRSENESDFSDWQQRSLCFDAKTKQTLSWHGLFWKPKYIAVVAIQGLFENAQKFSFGLPVVRTSIFSFQ